MKIIRYFLAAILVVVVGFGGLMFWRLINPPHPSICSDDVRGYREAAQSALTASGENLKKIGAELEGSTSRTYMDQLSHLSAGDFLALKACDTECKLLERCLEMNHFDSVQRGCAAEYTDYRARVDTALVLVMKLERYEEETESAVQSKVIASRSGTESRVKQSGSSELVGASSFNLDLSLHLHSADDLAKEILAIMNAHSNTPPTSSP